MRIAGDLKWNLWFFIAIIVTTILVVSKFDSELPPMSVGVIFADRLDVGEITVKGKPLDRLKPINSPCKCLGNRLDYFLETPFNFIYDPRSIYFRNPTIFYLGSRRGIISRPEPLDHIRLIQQEF